MDVQFQVCAGVTVVFLVVVVVALIRSIQGEGRDKDSW